MPATKLKSFLDDRGINYATLRHSTAFTALEIAESAHIADRGFAKTVIVKNEDEMAMVVLPANRRIVLPDLRDMLGSSHVRLATEDEFDDRFPDCALGAMPPFGNLYGLTVFVDESLAREPEIAFNAGNHSEVIQMPYDDFASLVHPVVTDLVTA